MNIMEIGLGSALRALLAALDSGVQEIYAETDESFRPRYFPVVSLLLTRPSMRVGELAVQCGVSQPAMTQTLASMRSSGIIADQVAANRRERLVSLTPEGRAQAARLQLIWSATGRAARKLETDCGPLAQVVGAALEALDREPFAARITKELS